jgi:hypothetical protein
MAKHRLKYPAQKTYFIAWNTDHLNPHYGVVMPDQELGSGQFKITYFNNRTAFANALKSFPSDSYDISEIE